MKINAMLLSSLLALTSAHHATAQFRSFSPDDFNNGKLEADAVEQKVTEFCARLLAKGPATPSGRLAVLERLLENHQVLRTNALLLKRAQLLVAGELIADLLVHNKVAELQQIRQTIKIFKETTWFGPAANWYLEYSRLDRLLGSERRIAFYNLVNELSGQLHSYSTSFSSYNKHPVRWVARKASLRLHLKAYLLFLPILTNVLKGKERSAAHQELWDLLADAVSISSSMLAALPDTVKEVSLTTPRMIKRLDRLFDVPIDEILASQEWVDAAKLELRHKMLP